MPPTSSVHRHEAPSAKWFLRLHPLVWVLAAIVFLLLVTRTVGDGLFAWLAPLGFAGFWLIITTLMILLVTLLILTKKRPEG